MATPIRTMLSDALTFQIQNWRSTASGFLSLVCITGVYCATVPVTLIQQMGVSQKEIAWATFVFGLAKLWNALTTKDAK
jgi:hypothetical protein